MNDDARISGQPIPNNKRSYGRSMPDDARLLARSIPDDEALAAVVDAHFARLMMSAAVRPSPVLERCAREVSKATRERNVCIDIPSAEHEALLESGVVGTPADPDRPMVLDVHGRLYLNRYWQYEQTIANTILERIAQPGAPGHIPGLSEGLAQRLNELFPDSADAHTADQRAAVEYALTHRLCIITGGPGTGKTTTVAILLALLVEFSAKDDLMILLGAPTGKAAARLQESIIAQKRRLGGIPDDVKQKIPDDAQTIHRMLRPKFGTPYFRQDRRHPLAADVIVLDECSMIDAALMAKFMDAVASHTQLILLGDKDQLSSVEAGAVFSDLCTAGLTCVRQLTHSYRFGGTSGIGALSRAVNEGDAGRAVGLCAEGREDIALRSFTDTDAYRSALARRLAEGYRAYCTAPTLEAAFQALREFKVLCAVREGPYGAAGVNALAEDVLAREGLIDRRGAGMWYKGRPVMITENDYGLSLFNGDAGIVWPDPEEEHDLLMVYFETGEGMKKYHPSTLPLHETVFAMTVHKSQGSQFRRVLTVLPQGESSVVTRELVYTALTRAEEQAHLWAGEQVLRDAVQRRTVRYSGLRDVLEEGMRGASIRRSGRPDG